MFYRSHSLVDNGPGRTGRVTRRAWEGSPGPGNGEGSPKSQGLLTRDRSSVPGEKSVVLHSTPTPRVSEVPGLTSPPCQVWHGTPT